METHYKSLFYIDREYKSQEIQRSLEEFILNEEISIVKRFCKLLSNFEIDFLKKIVQKDIRTKEDIAEISDKLDFYLIEENSLLILLVNRIQLMKSDYNEFIEDFNLKDVISKIESQYLKDILNFYLDSEINEEQLLSSISKILDEKIYINRLISKINLQFQYFDLLHQYQLLNSSKYQNFDYLKYFPSNESLAITEFLIENYKSLKTNSRFHYIYEFLIEEKISSFSKKDFEEFLSMYLGRKIVNIRESISYNVNKSTERQKILELKKLYYSI